jgi:hypothetical protein
MVFHFGRLRGPLLNPRGHVLGTQEQRLADVPARLAVPRVIGRDADLRHRGLPLVRHDGLPEEPQTFPRIDPQDGIGVGEARHVGEHERFAPLRRALLLSRGHDANVVGRAFAGAAVPAHQQIAAGQLHQGGGVVVLAVEREDVLLHDGWLGAQGGRQGYCQQCETGHRSHLLARGRTAGTFLSFTSLLKASRSALSSASSVFNCALILDTSSSCS